MKVLCCPADQAGCGHYRVFYPTAALAGEIDFEFTQHIPVQLTRTEPRQVLDVAPLDADVVILQRPLLRALVETIPHLQRKGIAVVVDIDDDFSCLHPNHPVKWQSHPKVNPEANWRHLQRACAIADVVTVSTPALAERYGARGNARVLANCVPSDMLSVTADRDGRTVGWGGFTVTHPGDLPVTRGGVAQALEATGARFLNIGNGGGIAPELGLAVAPDFTGGVPFADYPSAVAQLDVGIVPLADTRFNEAKSYLKGLEYAALRIPFVASPTREYVRLADEGIGLLAKDRGRDWARQLTRLLRDPGEVADRAHAHVAEHHTYAGNAWRWAEVWQEARDRRAAAPAVAA